ncbi:hypothetical protein COEREDRAFT_88766 [Coemansia reversa NRRL 1564]|uniref:GH18 domain-containing protein n=1 Tax=Coemansia reversa (strain ATCC 12441 / NRRL 1564) TaxID=763665 RepID=A0A2G5B6M8_COERN|nr:hypothetical protein COEREDRAFT_88766 [Coemansia reversa NRRL 1564]|eukprot:PIA14377.1 hypothetical protein COEREDRAFT_88766 [Coemansia reversa NRRL 1564]
MRFFLPLILLSSVCAASEPVVLGYYPSWKRVKMDGVDFSKYTHMNIAFSIPNRDGTFSFEDDWALPQILDQIRSGGAKVLMSVGGWTGSNLLSDILKDASARKNLLSSMTDYVKDNKLDGIDIDWEYPGRQGNTCNIVDAQNDAPNFLSFLKDLRENFDATFGNRKKLITLAVRVQPFDKQENPMDDVSEFAKYVDYANIMAYDINGPWNSVTGPNAPLNYENNKGTPLSFVSAIDAWTNAKWPANQLVAGLAFYGRSTSAQQDMRKEITNQYQPQKHEVPLGDSEDAPWYDACAGSTSASGTWQWKNLRSQGVLTNQNTAAEPWVRTWDKVTQTPWLFNPETKIFLSYDDPESIKIKSDYAASRGLAGVMIWSSNMDYNGELVNAARSFDRESGGSANNGTLESNSESHITSTSDTPINSSKESSAHSTQLSSSAASTLSSASATLTANSSISTNAPTASDSSNSSDETQKPSKPSDGTLTPGSACSEHATYQCVDSNGKKRSILGVC